MNTLQTNSNYIVFKKFLSIHSEDRDIFQWPDPSYFEITTPVEYKNVVGLRLIDIDLPDSFYVFSHVNQNTKLSFSILPSNTSSPNASILYNKQFTLMITSGTYDTDQFTIELAGTLNHLLSDFMTTSLSTPTTYNYFSVTYNPVTMKLMFLNKFDNFQFDFTKPELYNTCDTKLSYNISSTICYNNYTYWGLGSYLGFNKKIYTSKSTNIICKTPESYYVIESENTLDLYGHINIYLDLIDYNCMDEVMPYAYKSNASNNAKFGGKHNSSFAKVRIYPNGFDHATKLETKIYPIYFSDPPLERIQKMKFKLRQHDGRPFDLNNVDYSFTIEITMLKPDSIKPYININSSNYDL